MQVPVSAWWHNDSDDFSVVCSSGKCITTAFSWQQLQIIGFTKNLMDPVIERSFSTKKSFTVGKLAHMNIDLIIILLPIFQ